MDLRGSTEEVLARLTDTAAAGAAQDTTLPIEPRGRGRPRLGVVAREVTLLPRHRVAARPLLAVHPRAATVPPKVQALVDFLRGWVAQRAIN